MARKAFIIVLHSFAIRHDDTVKTCRASKGENTVIHWKTGTVALLTAALVSGSAALLASAPALAQTTVKLELWSRQDPSGPLRPGNVVKAAERLNKELEAEGSDKRVEVAVRESPAKGFDDDALAAPQGVRHRPGTRHVHRRA